MDSQQYKINKYNNKLALLEGGNVENIKSILANICCYLGSNIDLTIANIYEVNNTKKTVESDLINKYRGFTSSTYYKILYTQKNPIDNAITSFVCNIFRTNDMVSYIPQYEFFSTSTQQTHIWTTYPIKLGTIYANYTAIILIKLCSSTNKVTFHFYYYYRLSIGGPTVMNHVAILQLIKDKIDMLRKDIKSKTISNPIFEKLLKPVFDFDETKCFI